MCWLPKQVLNHHDRFSKQQHSQNSWWGVLLEELTITKKSCRELWTQRGWRLTGCESTLIRSFCATGDGTEVKETGLSLIWKSSLCKQAWRLKKVVCLRWSIGWHFDNVIVLIKDDEKWGRCSWRTNARRRRDRRFWQSRRPVPQHTTHKVCRETDSKATKRKRYQYRIIAWQSAAGQHTRFGGTWCRITCTKNNTPPNEASKCVDRQRPAWAASSLHHLEHKLLRHWRKKGIQAPGWPSNSNFSCR